MSLAHRASKLKLSLVRMKICVVRIFKNIFQYTHQPMVIIPLCRVIQMSKGVESFWFFLCYQNVRFGNSEFKVKIYEFEDFKQSLSLGHY
jgi:hypothetical protein